MAGLTNNLYPPIISTYAPAFVRTSECRVYFSLSAYNTLKDIGSVHIIVNNQNTNYSALNSETYPTGIKIIKSFEIKTDYDNNGDFQYYVTILPEDLKNGFEINQYYKVQIRFGHANAGFYDNEKYNNRIAYWIAENQELFSEWSTVCLIKGIEQPYIYLKGLNDQDNFSDTIYTTDIYSFVGKMYYKENNDIEKEYLKQYSIKIYNNNTEELLFDSGVVFTNKYNPNEINYNLQYILEDDIRYKVIFEYETINGYKKENNYTFILIRRDINPLNAEIIAETDSDNGCIKITMTGKEDLTYSNIAIKRSSSETNFKIWEDVNIQPYDNQKFEKIEEENTDPWESGWYIEYDKYYYIKENGTRARDEWIDEEYYVDEDGYWVRDKKEEPTTHPLIVTLTSSGTSDGFLNNRIITTTLDLSNYKERLERFGVGCFTYVLILPNYEVYGEKGEIRQGICYYSTSNFGTEHIRTVTLNDGTVVYFDPSAYYIESRVCGEENRSINKLISTEAEYVAVSRGPVTGHQNTNRAVLLCELFIKNGFTFENYKSTDTNNYIDEIYDMNYYKVDSNGNIVLQDPPEPQSPPTDIKQREETKISFVYEWKDYTVKSGILYNYGVQKINSKGLRGSMKYIPDLMMVVFDDIFLTRNGVQLKVKYNPSVASFKRNLLESKTDTIGSKYPFIRRNGNVGYRQFSLSGLVTAFCDENGENLNKENIYNKDYKDYYINYAEDNKINLYNDFLYEKEFRDKVIDFLYEDNIKLFRSTTEGNILVKLMDISFEPNQTLGRMLYSFNATAYEVDEYSIENCDYYNIQLIGEYKSISINKYEVLGQLNIDKNDIHKTSFNQTTIINAIDILKEKYNRSINGLKYEVGEVKWLRITVESDIPYEKLDPYHELHIDSQVIYINPNLSYECYDIGKIENLFMFEYPCCTYTIDYIIGIEVTEDTSKLLETTYYNINVGQLWGVFNPNVSIVKEISKKYFIQKEKYYRELLAIDKVRIEAEEGTVIKVKDSFDDQEYRHIIGSTGVLTLSDENSVIEELYFEGKYDYENDTVIPIPIEGIVDYIYETIGGVY